MIIAEPSTTTSEPQTQTQTQRNYPSLGYFKRPGVTILITSLFFFYLGYGVLELTGPDAFLMAVCRRALNDGSLTEYASVCQTDDIHTKVATYGGRLRTAGSIVGLLVKIHIYKFSDRYGRKPVIVMSMVAVLGAYLLQWGFVSYSLKVPLFLWVVPNIVFCTHFLMDFFLIYLADVASASKGKRSLQELATDVSFFYAFILFLGALIGPMLANTVAVGAVGSSFSEMSKLGLILVFAGVCCVIVILPESTTQESRDRATVKWDAEWSNLKWDERVLYIFNPLTPITRVLRLAPSPQDRQKNSFLLGYLSLFGIYGTAQYTGFLFYKRQWNWGMQEITVLSVEVTIILIVSQIFLGPLFVNTAEKLLNNNTSSTPVAILGCKLQSLLTFSVGFFQLLFSSHTVGTLAPILSGLSGTFISSTIALQMGLGPPEDMSVIMGGIGVARSLVSVPSEMILAVLFVSTISAPRIFQAALMAVDAVSLALLALASRENTGSIMLP
ncbi:hypothetical protein CJU89_3617 [Yarrowia sp. B02]|nr:hypothetical protein CJU89_3617 [Yarrowia sp. B02]